MKKTLLTITVAIITLASHAQSRNDAERLFNAGDYAAAKAIYTQLLNRRPNDPALNYSYARCLYEEGNLSAIRFFEETAKKYPESYRYIADLYFGDYQFAEAAQAYTDYLDAVGFDPDTKNLQAKSTIGADMLKHVENIQIIDSAIVSKTEFLRSYTLSPEAGKITKTTGNTTTCYTYTNERDDRQFTSVPTHNNQFDIHYTYRLLGEWSAPVSISANINTPANENYPFMMADGITFYFASDREEGLGGYDIYMTRFNPNTNDYLPPQNIGMPFNSPYNDYLFAVDETTGIGYFATDRYLPIDKVCIYRFIYKSEKQILKNIDYLQLRRLAQLLRTNHASPTETNTNKNEQTANNEGSATEQIAFTITPDITYTTLNQFKSAHTRDLYLELQELNGEYTTLEQEVASIRNRYPNASQQEKEQLTIAILTSERQLLSLQKLIRQQTIELRNEEIKLINAQQ